METLRCIDEFLIGKFERFSHWTQRWFGATSASWERLFLCLTIVQFVLGRFHWDGAGKFFAVLLFISWLARFTTSLWRTPPSIGHESVRNANRLREREARPFFFILAMIFFLPIDILTGDTLWFQCSQIATYFAVCDDLPKGRSKARRLAASLLAALRPRVTAPAFAALPETPDVKRQ